jgi:hypothetical protein
VSSVVSRAPWPNGPAMEAAQQEMVEPIPEQWSAFEAVLAAALVPRVVVFGACDVGKSHVLESLVDQSPLTDTRFAYWDMLSTPGARDRAGFWATLSYVLGGEDLRDRARLMRFLARENVPNRLILVLDHWDDAREDADDFVNLAALQELSDFVTSQRAVAVPGLSRLGLVLVTRFPTTSQFVQYAHRTRRPGFKRLSGDLERHYTAIRFPFLSRQASLELVRSRGVDEERARAIVELAGGWPGLLLSVLTRTETERHAEPRALALALQEDIPTLLGKTVLPHAMATGGVTSERAGWELLRREYQRDRSAFLYRYALPSSFDDPDAAPPLLHRFLMEVWS